jgi:hypothetical protein
LRLVDDPTCASFGVVYFLFEIDSDDDHNKEESTQNGGDDNGPGREYGNINNSCVNSESTADSGKTVASGGTRYAESTDLSGSVNTGASRY